MEVAEEIKIMDRRQAESQRGISGVVGVRFISDTLTKPVGLTRKATMQRERVPA